MNIEFFGLARQYANLKEELMEASDKVLSSGQVLDGNYTSEFEEAIAKRCNREYAVSVNSCTQGLIFAQQVLGIKGTVAIPPISFVATLNSVLMANNTPRYTDVDILGLMEVAEYPVDAIMYVNLFGSVLDYDKLRRLNPNAKIIEDAAQSFGAYIDDKPSGSLGDVSVLSFDPTKNLPNYGSGGMLLTDDMNTFIELKAIVNNGKIRGHNVPGTNSKMSEVDCAHMLVKLKYFDAWQARRKGIADYYSDNIKLDVVPLLPPVNVKHAWHKYVIRTSNRDKLMSYLGDKDIAMRVHYDNLLYDHSISTVQHEYSTVAEMHKKTALSLPIYPEMTDDEVMFVVDTINSFYS